VGFPTPGNPPYIPLAINWLLLKKLNNWTHVTTKLFTVLVAKCVRRLFIVCLFVCLLAGSYTSQSHFIISSRIVDYRSIVHLRTALFDVFTKKLHPWSKRILSFYLSACQSM